jgi:hypothetical protein
VSEHNWSSTVGDLGNPTSFAVDSSDRLYILNSSGELMRLVPPG